MKGLCFRCEHRVLFLENGAQPRCECGEIDKAKCACYMFKPVKPVVLSKLDKTDPRPQFGPAMISSRSCGMRIPDKLKLDIKKYKDGYLLYWRPDGKHKTKQKRKRKLSKIRTGGKA
jgi:hypothetical protein